MPREITHWAVLEEATEQVRARGALKVHKVLFEQRAAAYLGAMAHDMPYYYHGGGHPFEYVANILHGTNGNDTFEPLRALARSASKISDAETRELIVSFLLGMLSHAVTDICFHPMVFYFTGDYYDPNRKRELVAQARHRLFETYMDFYVGSEVSLWNHSRYRELLRVLGPQHLRAIADVADEVLVPEKLAKDGTTVTKPWFGAFREISFYQDLFFSSVVGAAFRALNWTLHSRLRGIDVLFSYGRKKPHPFFSTPLTFKNPVTGEPQSLSVTELRSMAAKRCADLFVRFDPLLNSAGEDLSQALVGLVGESLNLGLPGVTSRDAKFYSEIPLPFSDW